MVTRPQSAFEHALEDLQAEIVALAAAVPEAMAAAVQALLDGDRELAQSVSDSHVELTGAVARTENQAYELMVRHQPTAGDLRLVMTVIRLGREIERSSKLVRHVAEFALRRLTTVLSPRVRGLLERMGDEARALFLGAIDAYVARDLSRAEALDIWDDRLDELHREFLGELFSNPPDLETMIELVLVGRYIERVADHAVIVGQRVHYLVTGQLPPVRR